MICICLFFLFCSQQATCFDSWFLFHRGRFSAIPNTSKRGKYSRTREEFEVWRKLSTSLDCLRFLYLFRQIRRRASVQVSVRVICGWNQINVPGRNIWQIAICWCLADAVNTILSTTNVSYVTNNVRNGVQYHVVNPRDAVKRISTWYCTIIEHVIRRTWMTLRWFLSRGSVRNDRFVRSVCRKGQGVQPWAVT